MKDTGFSVDPAQQDRIAEPFALDPDTKAPARFPMDVRKQPRFLAGGHGMVSTAGDYLRFTQMLLNGGELDGTRILSRKTVELMTSDQVGSAIARGPLYYPGPGYGFGLGFRVRVAAGESANPGSVGDYSWEGAWGTMFFIDPKERLAAIWLTQRVNILASAYFWRRMRAVVYSATE